MTEIPFYITALATFLLVAVAAAGAATVVSYFAARKFKNDFPLDEDEDDNGGGGEADAPGRPPNGGGLDRISVQFNAIANAVGKTIEIEIMDKEKVLH